jgi:hypothetical protein
LSHTLQVDSIFNVPAGKDNSTSLRGKITYEMRNSSHGDVILPEDVHLPNVKVGCQKLKGQKRIEMKYCIQLWSDAKLAVVDGIWGDAVLWKTPIRM